MILILRNTVFRYLCFIKSIVKELKNRNRKKEKLWKTKVKELQNRKWKEEKLITCVACNKPSDDLLRSKNWGQLICCGHLVDGTPRCSICRRFQPAEEKYVNIDGGKLCSDCYSSAIFDQQNFEPLIDKLHEFYRSLDLEVDKDIPIFLVDEEEILRFSLQKINPKYSHLRLVRGLVNHPNGSSVTKITKCSLNEENIEVEKKVDLSTLNAKLMVLVLFGQPDVIISGCLAHEMMHVWLKLKGVSNKLERSIEEGICGVMEHKCMEAFCSSSEAHLNPSSSSSSYNSYKQVQFKRKLLQTWIRTMAIDQDKIHGQGYREVASAVEKFGFETTLRFIVEKQCLPSFPEKS